MRSQATTPLGYGFWRTMSHMPCVPNLPVVVGFCSKSQTEIGTPTLAAQRLGTLNYVHGIEQMQYMSNHS